ncbi:Peptidase S [Parasponia andersonii]|uniref:Peptidase S n=1 Tax=Parasponia andersonii TaxID=3476 RepID=A0A2P5BX92_PARAD|nr:Peptidase S [Parasponia andersonii]
MKSSYMFSWQWPHHFLLSSYLLLLIIILITAPSSASKLIKTPRLSPTGERLFLHNPESLTADSVSEDFETFFYNQTLDHFNYRPESYSTFQQRYLVNSKYWGGPNAPIFAYLGAEAPIDNDLTHRYYGKSIPFGSRKEALNNASTLGYFNSAQAIADYAEVLLHVKDKFHTETSPVIVIGGSYGGSK